MAAPIDIKVWQPENQSYIQDPQGGYLISDPTLPVDLSSATNLITFRDYGDGSNFLNISFFTIWASGNQSWGPAAFAMQNVQFPCTVALPFGDNSNPTFKIGLEIYQQGSRICCTLQSFWNKTDTFYDGLCITIPDTSWPELPLTSINTNGQILISGQFIYNNCFYNNSFMDGKSNIQDFIAIPVSSGINIKVCNSYIEAGLPVMLGNNWIEQMPGYESNKFYFWDLPNGAAKDDSKILTLDENTALLIIQIETIQNNTLTFSATGLYDLGNYMFAPILPPREIMIKSISSNVTYTVNFCYQGDFLGGVIQSTGSFYKSADNFFGVYCGILEEWDGVSKVPFLWFFGTEEWSEQYIDVLVKGFPVTIHCDNVPSNTQYLYLDENNIIQSAHIEEGNEEFKSCWFQHRLPLEMNEFISSEGLVPDYMQFKDEKGEEFSTYLNYQNRILYFSTDKVQDIYWTYVK